VSSTPSEQNSQGSAAPEELLDEHDQSYVHPAGKLGRFNSAVGMRVMVLAGLAFTVTIGMGTDGWGGSTCC
jgi:hypothetical protein